MNCHSEISIFPSPPPTSAQFSLSLDHVIGMILRNLNTAQLFKCRRLSRQWNFLASACIRKRVTIKFDRARDELYQSDEVFDKKFTELVTLPLNPKSPFPFPVSNFTFHYVDIYDSQVRNFLNVHGLHIHSLTLQYGVRRTEEQLMDFLSTLLREQTPNLEILTLNICAKNIEREEEERFFPPMHPEDPEFVKIYSCPKYKNPYSKLKVLRIELDISAKTFEVIYRMSPRLEEIVMISFYRRFWLSPINRVHVLKTFCSFWWFQHLRDEDDILGFLKSLNVNNKLKLSRIVLRYFDAFRFIGIRDGRKLLVDVTNYLFAISCDSVQSLAWINMSSLQDEGIKWRVMQNLKKLTVGHYFDTPGFPCRAPHIFPISFNSVQMFPQLQTVQLCVHGHSGNLLDLLHAFNFEPPAPSVRVVDVRDDSRDAVITAEHARLISNLFPRAQIVTGKSCIRASRVFLQISC